MKKMFLFFVLMLSTTLVVVAQDMIYPKESEAIQAKVVEITSFNVKYQNFGEENGVLRSMPKSKITKIVYQDGREENFNNKNLPRITGGGVSPMSEDCRQARIDAEMYYKNHKAAGTTTLISTLTFGALGGLVPAIACSAIPPKPHNLGYPNGTLMQNPEYARCYEQQARKKKSRKVWNNLLIGTGINIAAYFVLKSTL
ncbi:MAG: hypothetical protein IPL35_08365 [Sphingobacteriales bacterium]|nr:hypothetical protein [Sphingobacteriales bacterium]